MPVTDVHPVLMIIAGPAGTGKTTLAARIVAEVPEVEKVITVTTRPARPGEVDGKDYHFFSEEQFDRSLAHGEFLEWARVHGRFRYGTLRRSVHEKLAAGINLVMNVDVQGVRSINEVAKSDPMIRSALVTVFVKPPSMEELRKRLIGRGHDDEEEIARRLKSAENEMRSIDIFDEVIVSGSRREDFARVLAIWEAAARRESSQAS
ncbi:MAG TPA: guanylate kinase [Opitutaceae bacterium]|nr:guanylate kinase [Opitutaceae bacterium]